MNGFRRYRRITWTALWALVFAALAPTVPALHGGAGSIYADLCTAAGAVRVAITDIGDDGSSGAPSAVHGECPLCAARSLVLAGPSASFGVALRSDVHGVAPAEPTSHEFVRIAWPPANPRAPPLLPDTR
jgi:hypothetical protein